MTSLSTQQKLSMSLDDISDFEKSENKSTFELNVTEPLKNDILELENENEKFRRTISNLLQKNGDLESTNGILNKKISNMKRNFKSLLTEKQNATTELWKLQKEHKHLTHKYNENTEIITLYNWIIHIDSNSLEYVAGYSYHSESLWDTSFIKEKIAMSTYLLIITENETIYCLPYCESAK